MTGVEVSHDFDLPLTYYPRVPLAECVRLCEATPGCRSVSFHSALTLCSLKSATCAEAGFHGGGCRRRDTPAEHFIHKDRASRFVWPRWLPSWWWLLLLVCRAALGPGTFHLTLLLLPLL